MAFTYDPTTSRGKVRLRIYDTDTVNADRQIFTDAEIDAFLTLNTDIVILAAADALTTMAASQVFRLKVMKNMDLQLDGASVARELRMQAQALRDWWGEFGDGDFTGMIDWAEYTDTVFAKRERVIKQGQLD